MIFKNKKEVILDSDKTELLNDIENKLMELHLELTNLSFSLGISGKRVVDYDDFDRTWSELFKEYISTKGEK